MENNQPSYQPQSNSQSQQGYQSPLQQPVMQPELPQPPHHEELPPGTLTKHKSGFPAMLVGLAVGSLLVGGFMYVTLQAEKARSAALEQQVADMKKPTVASKVPAMGIEQEQLGMDTTTTETATTEVGTTQSSGSTNANFVTYQDKNIPALKFQYDKIKWSLDKSPEKGIIAFKPTSSIGESLWIYDLSTYQDPHGFESDITVKTNLVGVGKNYRLKEVEKSNDSFSTYFYYPGSTLINFDVNTGNFMSLRDECNDTHKFTGMGGKYDCRIFYDAKNAVEFQKPILLVKYTGSNPQEADEIVKQIKLD